MNESLESCAGCVPGVDQQRERGEVSAVKLKTAEEYYRLALEEILERLDGLIGPYVDEDRMSKVLNGILRKVRRVFPDPTPGKTPGETCVLPVLKRHVDLSWFPACDPCEATMRTLTFRRVCVTPHHVGGEHIWLWWSEETPGRVYQAGDPVPVEVYE